MSTRELYILYACPKRRDDDDAAVQRDEDEATKVLAAVMEGLKAKGNHHVLPRIETAHQAWWRWGKAAGGFRAYVAEIPQRYDVLVFPDEPTGSATGQFAHKALTEGRPGLRLWRGGKLLRVQRVERTGKGRAACYTISP